MTRAGCAYELRMPVLPTVEHGSSSLLPTPMTVNTTSERAQTGRPTAGPQRGGPSFGLQDVVSLLPTPQWADGKGCTTNARGNPMLGETVTLLPTPVVNDMGAGKTPEAWDEWTDRMRSAHGNGNGHGPSLSIEVARLLPTPTTEDHGHDAPGRTGGAGLTSSFVTTLFPTPRATDGEKGGPNQRGSAGDLMLPSAVVQLLPTPTSQAAKHSTDDRGPGTLDDFNLWSLVTRPETFSGEPTDPPSDAGRTSSDAELPGQLSLDVQESA